MTDRAEIERIIKAAYAGRKAGDLDAISKVFASDARFQVAGSSVASPAALKAEGAKAMQATLKEMITVFEWIDQEILSMVVEGNKAAVHWRGTIRSTATGETVRTELFDLFEIDGGRISSLIEFCDTALAARLMGAPGH
jgi:ketosteroid isomerase-like protein